MKLASLPSGEWLAEADGHRVWWCEAGDAAGLPLLVLHGGPGGASRPEPFGWFAGLPLRCLAIDQRGCGRSTPLGRTEANDVDALLDDIERLRERLAIGRWALAGGSWGARLALAYAARRPDRVAGLFLRSPFLGTRAETARYIDAWLRWLGAAGRRWLGEAGADAVQALYGGAPAVARPLDPDVLHSERVARAWSAYDDAQARPGGAPPGGFDEAALPQAGEALLASWRVHLEYALGGWGAATGHAAGVPAGLEPPGPLAVAWGAEDATCDPAVARALGVAWPRAVLSEAPGAGHRMGDERLAPRLETAARDWAARLLAQAAALGSPVRQRSLR